MRSFDHFNPTSLPAALKLLADLQGQARVMAGGTVLLPQMKAGAVAPTAVVNIKRLAELKELSYDQQAGLHLGALTTLRELARTTTVRAHYPALAQIAGLMATTQIRNLATVGGNLCNAAPFADLAPPLIALGATVHLASSTAERQLLLEEFFLGPGQPALAPGELLIRLSLPPPQGETIYIKHTLRPATFLGPGVVGVAVQLWQVDGLCQAVRLVLGAVGPAPRRARQAEARLLGQSLTAERIAQAAQLAASESSPVDDLRSSAWYRQRIIQVWVARALTKLAS